MAECYYFQILLYSLSVSFCFLFPHTSSLNFEFTNLSDQDQKFKTFGTAYFSGQVLELTSNQSNPNSYYNDGIAAYVEPLHLWNKTSRKLADFNTSFVFVVNSEGKYVWDEFRFFLAPLGSDLPNTDLRSLVAVEFNAAKDNNVTINVNSYTANVAAPWYVDITGKDNGAWISYNSSSQVLSVVFTGSTNRTWVQDTISFGVDLRDHLPERVTVGFYARGYFTSSYFQTNTIKSWEFSSNFVPYEINNIAPIPAPSKPFSVSTVVGSVVGGTSGLAILGLLFFKRTQVAEFLQCVGKCGEGIGKCGEWLGGPAGSGSSQPNNNSGGTGSGSVEEGPKQEPKASVPSK